VVVQHKRLPERGRLDYLQPIRVMIWISRSIGTGCQATGPPRYPNPLGSGHDLHALKLGFTLKEDLSKRHLQQKLLSHLLFIPAKQCPWLRHAAVPDL